MRNLVPLTKIILTLGTAVWAIVLQKPESLLLLCLFEILILLVSGELFRSIKALVMLTVFAAFLGTLLGAASMVAVACVRRAKTSKRACVNLLVACAVCGLVVMVLTVGTFSTLNHVSIDTSALGMWFAADAIVNIAMLLAASRFAK